LTRKWQWSEDVCQEIAKEKVVSVISE